ncbi:MAG TPA: hypothetical protein VNT76_00360 [Candidatus Binatus sp.]|nr:hypothetical protein [Candidatus Binatus sp.]
MERQEKTKAPAINPLLAGFICVVIVGFLSLLCVALVIQARTIEPAAEPVAKVPQQTDDEIAAETEKSRLKAITSEARDAENLEKLLTILHKGGITKATVDSVSISGPTATFRVSNSWHARHYQVRYQAAQNLYAIWQSAFGNEAVAMEITDRNGNEVGGFGFTGVWVQK